MKGKIKVIIAMVVLMSVVNISNFASPSEWAEKGVFTLKYIGLLEGDLGDMNKLQNNITREEFAELAVRMYLQTKGQKIENLELGSRFEDSDNPYVSAAYNLGIVKGVNSQSFAPTDLVTREEIAAMFLRELKVLGVETAVTQTTNYADYNSVSVWAQSGIDFISQEGIMNGIGNNKVAPKDNATREEAISLIHKIGVKYKWFGTFKSYDEGQYETRDGFKVPKQAITQMNVFRLDSTNYDLNIVLKGYTIDGTALDVANQHNQLYEILNSHEGISFKATDQLMAMVKGAWNTYEKEYKLAAPQYIECLTGRITSTVPTTSYILVSENAVLNIRIKMN